LGEGLEAGAQQVAEGPGCVGGEGWEDEGAVYAVELVEFARGEGDFGCHVYCGCLVFFLGRSWRRGLEMSVLYFFVGAMGSLYDVFVRVDVMW
jgi:hypothetical protein